jgi:signal transduction histidine kinase/CheY-like chemotaxis protein
MNGDRDAQASRLENGADPLLRAVVLSNDRTVTAAASAALVRAGVGCIAVTDLLELVGVLHGHQVDLVVCDDRALGKPLGASLSALRRAVPAARLVLLVDSHLAAVAQDLPRRIADAVAWVRSGQGLADDDGQLEAVCAATLDAAQPMAALVVAASGLTKAANGVAIASGCAVGGLLPTLEAFPLTTWSLAESQRAHRLFAAQAWRRAGRWDLTDQPTRLFALRSTRLPNGSYLMSGCEIADADDQVNDVVRVLSPREERLQALESFASGMGREFGELLGVVGGCAQLLEQRFPRAQDEPELGAIVAPLQQAVRQGMEMIERLRSFTRQAGLEREELDLVAILRDWSRGVRAMVGGELQVEVASDRASAPITGNHKSLHEALGELAANAIEAVRRSSRRDRQLRLRVIGERLSDGREAVAIAISDNGVGIDAALLERIFDPFFTTTPGAAHRGLGLSSVHSIVRAHGGEVRVSSVADKGSDFRIVLPTTVAPRGQGQAQPGFRVMMVGNDPLALEINACALRALGCVVRVAVDRATALAGLAEAQAEGIGAAPQALVIDTCLETESADGLVCLARRLCPELKIILIADSLARIGHQGLPGARVDRILRRPCGAWDLHNALHHVIAGKPPGQGAAS